MPKTAEISPRRAAQVRAEAPPPAPEPVGVTVLERALRILEVFGPEPGFISLAELSRRTGLHKTTVLRLVRTLATSRYLVRRQDGAWRLGPAIGWLGAKYQATFDVDSVVEPLLRDLSMSVGESASFYVREGESRTCLVRVEGPQAIRHHVRMGESLPLDKGAPGHVILAFCGESGKLYEQIRSKGYHVTSGERDLQVASVAAPVFGANWSLLGSLGVSGPASRLSMSTLTRLAPKVIETATRLSYELGGARPLPVTTQSTWYPSSPG